MHILSHLFLGLIFIALGVLGLKYTFSIMNYTGRQDWIESKLGSGSTYGVYKIFSVLLVLGGLLYATGLAGNVFGPLLSPLKGLFKGVQQ